jgi:hypothetical protein
VWVASMAWLAGISPKTADGCSAPVCGSLDPGVEPLVGVMGEMNRLAGRCRQVGFVEGSADVLLDLVGVWEAAELVGISRSALAARRISHSSFPRPVAEPRCGPVWFRWQIQEYVAEERRLGPRGWYGQRVHLPSRR